MPDSSNEIVKGSKKHPKQEGSVFQYGTAGFRMNAKRLDSVVYRVGLLASLRSRILNGDTIGVMITASHNPPEDNGVKIVDPMGDMLEASWELYATDLANASTDDDLVSVYTNIQRLEKIGMKAPSNVIFARDTRVSGSTLVTCLTDALKATNTKFTDYKILTTPQLHYLVRCTNTSGTIDDYGEVSEQGYYKKLGSGFTLAMKHRKPADVGSVTVDCANGVGGFKLKELLKYIPSKAEGGVEINLVNDDILKPDSLNMDCGADYVKTNQRAPLVNKIGTHQRWASLDGDGDRLVYYCCDPDNKFHLLDGDRIAVLVAMYLRDLINQAGLSKDFDIAVVQTAYANGRSTEFLQQRLGLRVECASTGVKHLHKIAKRFSVGIYFEANGHGTVLFSSWALSAIAKHDPINIWQQNATETLQGLVSLINQTVGDGFSILLLVETILAHKEWGVEPWYNMYDDLPNTLLRVKVRDRNMFKTEDADRRLVSPLFMQDEIDDAVKKYRGGRAFVRASGTEDVVRIYVEASTKMEMEHLSRIVLNLVKRYASGEHVGTVYQVSQ